MAHSAIDIKKEKRAKFIRENEEQARLAFAAPEDSSEAHQLMSALGQKAKREGIYSSGFAAFSAAMGLKKIAKNYIGWNFTRNEGESTKSNNG